MQKLQIQLDGVSRDCDCYIAADDGFVSAIILYTIISKPHGDVWIGAYYGSVGGGENDGGFFRIDVEKSAADHLDYDEVEGLGEDDPIQAAEFEAVMQALWTLIQEDEGDLTLTDIGSSHYIPGEDGIWMDAEFDGDSLDKVSAQWKIGLRFES